MNQYKKIFGIIRILLGILFFLYPTYEFLNQNGTQSDDSIRWLFVMIFFMLYSYSAIRNGIRELGGIQPAFNLPRFFEASMNGFLSIYLFILFFVSEMNASAKIILFILALATLFSMIRDIRIISLQYLERKQRTRK